MSSNTRSEKVDEEIHLEFLITIRVRCYRVKDVNDH